MSEVHDKSLELAKEWLDNISDEKFLIEHLEISNKEKDYTIAFQEELIGKLRKEKNALQAKIDQLMLEFCPEEMTQEQIENWEQHQVVSTHSTKEDVENNIYTASGEYLDDFAKRVLVGKLFRQPTETDADFRKRLLNSQDLEAIRVVLAQSGMKCANSTREDIIQNHKHDTTPSTNFLETNISSEYLGKLAENSMESIMNSDPEDATFSEVSCSHGREQKKTTPDFKKRMADGFMFGANFMVVCSECGNKRRPKASNFSFKCTNSNEVGQVGEVDKSLFNYDKPVITTGCDVSDATWGEEKLEELQQFIDKIRKEEQSSRKCCEGGPQWGHAWDCPKCPD